MNRLHQRRLSPTRMTIDQQRRVLVVDDDSDIRLMIGAALRQKSLMVDEAADGAEAIRLLRQHSYPVVLIDLLMPSVDGFDVIEAIRAKIGDSPVVLVITGAERGVIEQLDASRIHGVINKPFDPAEVAAIVAACIEIRGRRALETMAIATILSTQALLGPWL